MWKLSILLLWSYIWSILLIKCCFPSISLSEEESDLHREILPDNSNHHHAHQKRPSLDLVKLVVLNISDGTNNVTCLTTPACKYKTFYGMRITSSSLVDNQKKILMEFSPKADCTSATVMFLNHMGFRYGVEFTGWPHSFRDQYYNLKCGKATPCAYYRSDWFRFKIVRNPWDRTVSSYIHVMTYAELRDKVIPTKDRNSLSFAKYVSLLEKLSPRELQGFAGAHAGFQSHSYERIFYSTNVTVFHEIVQAEKPYEALSRINRRLGTNFSVGFRAHHYADRRSDIKRFVGNMPWQLLQNQIPSNYGFFYTQELRLRVHQIFLWDILLYNYTFPYQLSPTLALPTMLPLSASEETVNVA